MDQKKREGTQPIAKSSLRAFQRYANDLLNRFLRRVRAEKRFPSPMCVLREGEIFDRSDTKSERKIGARHTLGEGGFSALTQRRKRFERSLARRFKALGELFLMVWVRLRFFLKFFIKNSATSFVTSSAKT